MNPQAEDAANRLFEEHQKGIAFSSISDTFCIRDIAGAYDVQDRLVRMLRDRNGAPCGYKIGLTSKAMQEMCGIDQPIAGIVLSERQMESGVTVSLGAHGRIGIEFEVGVRLGSDLGAPKRSVSREDVAAAVDGVCAAFELIDDRNADYGALDMRSVVSDNSWNAGAVLSDFVAPPDDLAAVVGTVVLNDTEVASGPGSAALGHPYEPVRWLADHLAARGQKLHEGEIVLTGSLVKTMFPAAGDRFEFAVTEIGDVSISFVA